MSEATVKQQWLIIHREHEGFRNLKKKNKAWGTAGGKVNFAGSGTENLSGLRDSLDAVAPSSYALTADNGLKLDDMR